MKNIQIIDGAENCTFSIFQATDDEFALIFPLAGQDIEFAEDLSQRLHPELLQRTLSPIWERPIRKPEAAGIHGTLYYGFEHRRGHFPQSKREKDWPAHSVNLAQRRMYASL